MNKLGLFLSLIALMIHGLHAFDSHHLPLSPGNWWEYDVIDRLGGSVVYPGPDRIDTCKMILWIRDTIESGNAKTVKGKAVLLKKRDPEHYVSGVQFDIRDSFLVIHDFGGRFWGNWHVWDFFKQGTLAIMDSGGCLAIPDTISATGIWDSVVVSRPQMGPDLSWYRLRREMGVTSFHVSFTSLSTYFCGGDVVGYHNRDARRRASGRHCDVMPPIEYSIIRGALPFDTAVLLGDTSLNGENPIVFEVERYDRLFALEKMATASCPGYGFMDFTLERLEGGGGLMNWQFCCGIPSCQASLTVNYTGKKYLVPFSGDSLEMTVPAIRGDTLFLRFDSIPHSGTEIAGMKGSRIFVSASPNPFNASTRILAEAFGGPVQFRIFDIRGNLVRGISGKSEFTWDGRDMRGRPLPAGVYMARVTAAGKSEEIKLFLAK